MQPAAFPDKLQFLFRPARYKVAYGGRGGAKSTNFARALLIKGGQERLRILCARETQKSIADSVHHLLESQIEELGLRDFYEVQKATILGKNGSEFIFTGLRHNVDNLKSIEACDICWVEEAQSVSKSSWETLTPTIRKENSEIWVSFNPDLETDETYKKFVISPPPGAIVERLTYRDNPWFPDVLRREMEHLRETDPAAYEHVWEGSCITVIEGAVYAAELHELDRSQRICRVPYDPQHPVMTFWDLGYGDSTAIWFAQVVGMEYRLIDYHEDSRKSLAEYLKVLQEKGYVYEKDYLPHDAQSKQLGSGKSIEELMRAAGRRVEIVPRLSINDGINAVRTILPVCWFDAEKCQDGLQALRHYRYGIVQTLGSPTREPLHDQACFHPDTLVLTRHGKCRILDLPVRNGEVLTPCGWRQYEGPWITQRNAPLVEVRFSDKSTVRCTPEHLFLTECGWRSASSLQPGSTIRSALTRSRSISMGVYGVFGRLSGTSAANIGNGYILRFGKLLSDLYRRVVPSITSMRTVSTTGSTTWSVFPSLSMRPRPIAEGHRLLFQSEQGRQPLIGTAQKRASYGTAGTHKSPSPGLSGIVSSGLANSVLSRIWRWIRPYVSRGTAPRYAKPLHVDSVSSMSERSDVCCIHVEDGHWFTLANGAVVHNSHGSDAFRYMAVGVKRPPALDWKKPVQGPLIYDVDAANTGWMQ